MSIGDLEPPEEARAGALDVFDGAVSDPAPASGNVELRPRFVTVRAGDWQRVVHGNAEITGADDVLRLAYQSAQARRHPAVKLPIVLAAMRRP